jgi:hypothetical protein
VGWRPSFCRETLLENPAAIDCAGNLAITDFRGRIDFSCAARLGGMQIGCPDQATAWAA